MHFRRFIPFALAALVWSKPMVGLLHAQKMHPEKEYPTFPVGPTGILATIAKGGSVTVQNVHSETPAAHTPLQAGDTLLAVNRHDLDVEDPRVPLGQAIGEAEAGNGQLIFTASRGDKQAKVIIQLPRLGPYTKSWPEKDNKSATIIQTTASYVAKNQQNNGAYQLGPGRPERESLNACLASLFLLSTGDPQYLPHVQRHARALATKVEKQPTQNNWHLGYQGILLAEYYLKTGDRSVLAGLQSLCDQAIKAQVAGGWGHRGIPGPGYVQSGLMSSAGVPVLTTLILANECGVKINQKAYAKAVQFMFRMVGHGCVPYGDHRSELWWSNTNGRNAKLACAFSLFSDPVFQQASEHLATLVTDSYFQPEFGHTGGGFNVIWRGMASVHVPAHRRHHYSRQMDKLAWYYDLSRQPDGSFYLLPTPPDNTRYAGPVWGTGAIGLTYTAPLRQLRILGRPPGQFSVTTTAPKIDWGTNADLVFHSSQHAVGFGKETTEPHLIYDQTIGSHKNSASIAFCAKHIKHYNPLVRSWCTRVLKNKPSPEAYQVIAAAIAHTDPRVRRAGFDTISGYDNWSRPCKSSIPSEIVSERFLPAILKTLHHPKSAWWEIDGALFALGRAKPEDIRKQMSTINRFAQHQEWYLREAAFWAMVGLHQTMTGPEFENLTAMYARSRHVFERSSYDRGFWMILKKDQLLLQQTTERSVARQLGKTLHSAPIIPAYGEAAVHEAAHRTMMITRHFDTRINTELIPDLVRYLKIWNPYHQHSTWMISCSKWQPGILKLIKDMGKEAQPLVDELKLLLKRYDHFDPKRDGRHGKIASELKQQIETAVADWKKNLH